VILAVATLTQAATGFVFVGVGTLAGFLQRAFSLSGAQTGLVVTAVGVVPLFALLPVGRLLDRHGERAIVSGGALLLAAGAGAAAFAPSYPLLLALLLVGGSGYATSQPGGSKAVARWFEADHRGLAMGIRQTGLPLGGAAAAAILPALAASAGWREALGSAAAVAAVGAILFALAYRPIERNPVDGYAFMAQLRRLVGSPAMRPVLWAGVVLVGAQFCIISYLMLFLRDRHGVPLARGAWFLFTAQALGAVGRVVLGTRSDRLGHGRRMRSVEESLVLAAGSTFVLPLLSPEAGVGVLLLVAAVLGFFAFGWYGPWVVHVAEVAPRGAVGLTLGLAMTINQLGIVGAPPLFGLALDLSGSYLVAWWALAAALSLVALRVGLGIRRGEA
jgi:predicted MFS family arabinose efflux permease